MKKVLAILAAAVIVGGIWWVLEREEVQAPSDAMNQPSPNFVRTGNLVGSRESGWGIVYEEPGKPALTASLRFGEESRCTMPDGNSISCLAFNTDRPWEAGARATITGTESGGVVEVRSAVFLTVK